MQCKDAGHQVLKAPGKDKGMPRFKEIFITGGAGYIGAVLVPQLIYSGYRVRVLDLFLFGDDVFDNLEKHPNLELIKGDIRNEDLLRRTIPGCDAVIHLACISNDPSFELDPELGKSINFDAFEPLVKISKSSGVKRFIYASSSSVYGISESENVGEDHPLNPITDYSKFKSLCEPILLNHASPDFVPVVLRPATVCGYSPRQRFDLTVNILTNHAVHKKSISVFGGTQLRPNIHIQDMADLYTMLLELPDVKVASKTYNAGYENYSVSRLAEMVRDVVQERMPEFGPIQLVTTPSNDLRSYHISSGKIKRDLGFAPMHSVQDAVRDLVDALQTGKLPNSMTDARYFNIKTMQEKKIYQNYESRLL